MVETEAELATLIAAGGSFDVRGSGTKQGLGRPVRGDTLLDMSAFNGISLYEPDELVLEAGAATPLATIEKALAKNHQHLAFEPPNYARLLGVKGSGTIGGIMACGLSGPRRLKAGAARDHILGFRGVSGRGEVFKAGGRVVKNVTGFDLSKLMAGSYGTLVALTSVTVKVLPVGETEETLVLTGLDDARAVKAMSLAMQSACEVSAAAHLPGIATVLRLEGVRPSVVYRRDRLAGLLAEFGRCDVLAEKPSAKQWQQIRDVHPLCGDENRAIWKLSVTPSLAPGIVATISGQLEARYFFDWAGGLIWLSVPAAADASAPIIRGSFAEGHATLMRASTEVRATVDIFHPQTSALAGLTTRVKQTFDPNAVLNPGRMYKDV